MKLSLCCLALFACAGCPPQPAPQPGVPDAAVTTSDASTPVLDAFTPPPQPTADAAAPPSTPIGDACANLAAVGCPEGASSACVPAVSKAISDRLTKVDLPCLTAAKTKAAARKCGFVACP